MIVKIFVLEGCLVYNTWGVYTSIKNPCSIWLDVSADRQVSAIEDVTEPISIFVFYFILIQWFPLSLIGREFMRRLVACDASAPIRVFDKSSCVYGAPVAVLRQRALLKSGLPPAGAG